MKRITAFFTFLLFFSLCSCNSNQVDQLEGVPCPIAQIDWGMSKEECLSALAVDEQDAAITKKAEDAGFTSVDVVLPGSYEAFGLPAEVQLFFCEDYKGLQPGLISMRLKLGKDIDLDQLEQKITDFAGGKATLQQGRWISEKSIYDVPQAIVDEYFHVMPNLSAEVNPLGFIGIERAIHKLTGETFVTINDTGAVLANKAID